MSSSSSDTVDEASSTESSDSTPPRIRKITREIEYMLQKVSANHHFTISQIEQIAGFQVGDGFMSDLLALRLHGRSTINAHAQFSDVICKRPPRHAALRDHFNSTWVFEREVFMYAKVLPLFERMQREMGLDRDGGFFAWPKCFYASYTRGRTSQAIILMEDLRSVGYRMWEKTIVAPPENITLFVEQLARMHALSFVLRDQQPRVLAEINQRLTEIFVPIAQSRAFKAMFVACFKKLAALMRSTAYEGLVDGIAKHWLDLYRASFDKKRLGRFAVVSHGDCWSNNMMYAYQNGIAHKISLFDWQVAHMRSPVADLLNYIFGVSDKASRQHHLAEYLDTYYTNVAEMVRIFGSDPEELFTRSDFDEELRRNAFYFVVNAAVFLPSAVSNDAVDMADLASLAELNELDDESVFVRVDYAAGGKMQQRYLDMLEYADEKGWLDELRELIAALEENNEAPAEDTK